jgi:intracellular multiplication protein IcmP
MAGQSRQEKTVTMDDPLVIMLVVVFIYGMCWAIWKFGHTYIATAYGYVRYAQFYLVHLVGEIVDLPGVAFLHAWIAKLCAPDGVVSLCQRDFSTVTWPEIANSTFYINVVMVVFLVIYCIRLFMRANGIHPKIRFSRSHDIKSFVKELMSAKHPKDGKLLYPHLRMFSALNLIGTPLDDPVFGMSHTSKQFVFKHRLVTDWRAEGQGAWAPTLDRQKAALVFREQLGKHWTSSANLSPGETLLVAIAMPRVAATDSELDDHDFKAAMAASDDMVRYCWEQFVPPATTKKKAKSDGVTAADPHAWLRPKIDLTKPREVIQKYIRCKAVHTIIERHAFNRTVIFAMFMQARRLGVLPPADMRWLRFYDRGLWYVLENIGRQAGYAEAAGVMSHFLYEVRAGMSIVEPQLDKAVSGLEVAISNFKFPDADRSLYIGAASKPPSVGEAAKR